MVKNLDENGIVHNVDKYLEKKALEMSAAVFLGERITLVNMGLDFQEPMYVQYNLIWSVSIVKTLFENCSSSYFEFYREYYLH